MEDIITPYHEGSPGRVAKGFLRYIWSFHRSPEDDGCCNAVGAFIPGPLCKGKCQSGGNQKMLQWGCNDTCSLNTQPINN